MNSEATRIKDKTTYDAETGVITMPTPMRLAHRSLEGRSVVPFGAALSVADLWERRGFAAHAAALRMTVAEVAA